MKSEHKNLLYNTKVRWLSKGNVLSRVFELCDELKIYLNDTKPELAFHFTNAKFIACLAYVVDIFHSLNILNLKMQGKEKTLFRTWTRSVHLLKNWQTGDEKLKAAILQCLITCLIFSRLTMN